MKFENPVSRHWTFSLKDLAFYFWIILEDQNIITGQCPPPPPNTSPARIPHKLAEKYEKNFLK
jgi:hypothetical protein